MAAKLENYHAVPDAYLRARMRLGNIVQELHQLNPGMHHTKGSTYLCKLSNGYLKVGTTTNVARRMKDLNAELLYLLDGGESLELLAHYQLNQYRIPCAGEVFFADKAVLEWFESKLPERVAAIRGPEKQTCPHCGETKRMVAFGTHRTAKSGYYTKCRDCRYSILPDFARIRTG